MISAWPRTVPVDASNGSRVISGAVLADRRHVVRLVVLGLRFPVLSGALFVVVVVFVVRGLVA